MSHVVIVGCGVVGAAIAYELSLNPELNITVLDQQAPAQGSTGAALGVLMGGISQKKKGRAWAMRDASIRRYDTLIPELEAITGIQIPFNRHGIVRLRFDGNDEDDKWQALSELRRSQGWQLDVWDVETLKRRCPLVGTHLGDRRMTGAIHSIHDRQVDPIALTHALVAAAKLNGVEFQFNAMVTTVSLLEGLPAVSTGNSFEQHQNQASDHALYHVEYRYLNHITNDTSLKDSSLDIAASDTRYLPANWIVLSTGLGTFSLTASIVAPPQAGLNSSAQPINDGASPVDIRPVAGQAVRIKLPQPIPNDRFTPVISGNDIHVVPLGLGNYWVGATVEFPDEAIAYAGMQDVTVQDSLLATVLNGAYDLFPALSDGTIIQKWVGYRPRPWNRPAPIIEPMNDHPSIILATGHYRNGVLLAPATAQRVRAHIESSHALKRA